MILAPIDDEIAKLKIYRSDFKYPISFDFQNKFVANNKLPEDPLYHTMLLNEDNIILAVGNPVNNPHVRTLYKDIISGSNSYGNYLDSTSINVTISRAYRQLGLVKAHHTIKEEFYISNH